MKTSKILNQLNNCLTPDTEAKIAMRLLDEYGIKYRMCKEGILIEQRLQVNFYHSKRSSGATVHRKGMSSILKIINAKVNQ